MNPFTTLVVFDRPRGGMFCKVTFPFDAAGMSRDELVDAVLKYAPYAYNIVIPTDDGGFYDVDISTFRTMDQQNLARNSKPLSEQLRAYIDSYETVLGKPIRPLIET